MYITKNAVYLHVPKTAGTWMELVIQPAVLEQHDTNLDYLPDKFNHCFAVVRNPWCWYVSLYKFCTIGSEMEMPLWPTTIMSTIGKEVSFEEFMDIMLTPSLEFRKKLIEVNRVVFLKDYFVKNDDWILKNRIKNTFRPIAREWVNTSDNFYRHIFNIYTKHATDIGTYCSIKDDLRKFIIKVEDMTPTIENNLHSIPPINYTPKSNYRDYYTTNLRDKVFKHNEDIINQFNFKY
jgi:hypothetical protein